MVKVLKIHNHLSNIGPDIWTLTTLRTSRSRPHRRFNTWDSTDLSLNNLRRLQKLKRPKTFAETPKTILCETSAQINRHTAGSEEASGDSDHHINTSLETSELMFKQRVPSLSDLFTGGGGRRRAAHSSHPAFIYSNL